MRRLNLNIILFFFITTFWLIIPTNQAIADEPVNPVCGGSKIGEVIDPVGAVCQEAANKTFTNQSNQTKNCDSAYYVLNLSDPRNSVQCAQASGRGCNNRNWCRAPV